MNQNPKELHACKPLLVSVVIPVYNSELTIATAIDSVISQSYSVYEIIVIDDGSTDGSKNIVLSYGAKVRYLSQANRGPSAARNKGIREATGDLIAFLDADDVWFPNKLELQVDVFVRNSQLGLCPTAYYACDINLESCLLKSAEINSNRSISKRLMIHNIFQTSTIMVRRDCFHTVGLFDETINFGEDWDMWLRLASRYECHYIYTPLCYYRQIDSGITKSRGNENFLDWEKLIIKIKERENAFFSRHIVYLKSMSWLYHNNCMHFQENQRYVDAAFFLVLSIIYWPFNAYYRYLRLFKIFVKFIFRIV